MKKQISEELKAYFSELGKRGGKARARLSKEELSRIGKTGGRPKKK